MRERENFREQDVPDRDVVPGDRLPDGRIVGAPPRLIDRRSLLLGGGAAIAAGGFTLGRLTAEPSASDNGLSVRPNENVDNGASPSPPRAGDWSSVHAQ